jgi:hypothetical protein
MLIHEFGIWNSLSGPNLRARNLRGWRRHLPAQNLIQTEARAFQLVERIPQRFPFIKVGTSAIFTIFAAPNDRETGKKGKCAAIMIVFRRNPGVV